MSWEAGADRDVTEQQRQRGGEQQRQRGPALVAAPRTGEQQHPGGLLVDGGPKNVAVIPPLLCFPVSFSFYCCISGAEGEV